MCSPKCISPKVINNSLFVSMCILRDLPWHKNPRALCWGSSPLPCSHGNISFLWNGKNWGNKKRVVCVRGSSSSRAFSWGLGTPSQSRPQVPLPQENALLRNWCKKKKMDLMCPINWLHANWRLMMNNWIRALSPWYPMWIHLNEKSNN